jgi:recombination protein RecR
MQLSSKLLENAVSAFASLPGIGKKSALRLALHLIKQSPDFTQNFVRQIADMREHIQQCSVCHNIADTPICDICADNRRDKTVVCIVESIRDVMAIEETGQYRGQYHILGGVISPLEGISPQDLNVDSLLHRLDDKQIKEIIMAISPTIEGETTIYYLSKKVEPLGVRVSTLARGISFGGELEYADELTLGRSIVSRIPYKH